MRGEKEWLRAEGREGVLGSEGKGKENKMHKEKAGEGKEGKGIVWSG